MNGDPKKDSQLSRADDWLNKVIDPSDEQDTETEQDSEYQDEDQKQDADNG